MSTRGTFIIRKNAAEKALFIACDAYPNWMADEITKLVKLIDLEKLFNLMVEQDEFDVSVDSSADCLNNFNTTTMIRACENNKRLIFESDAKNIFNSLFCEYAYVINLDEQILEYYEGFQRVPQKGNRYGQEPYETRIGEIYYPCALCNVFKLQDIRKMTASDLSEQMENSEPLEDASVVQARHLSEDLSPVDSIAVLRKVLALSNHLNIIARDLTVIPVLQRKNAEKILHDCQMIDACIESIKQNI
jgi:hypothetical protein